MSDAIRIARYQRIELYRCDTQKLLDELRRRLLIDGSQTSANCVKLIEHHLERYEP